MKIIPVRQDVIPKHFGHFIEGVEKVLDHSDHDLDLATVYNHLLSGAYLMYAVYEEKKLLGFYVGRYDLKPDGSVDFVVVQFYLKPDVDSDTFALVEKALCDIAATTKCKRVRCYSLRKGMGKRLIPLGYREGYIEYIKEIGGEKNGR